MINPAFHQIAISGFKSGTAEQRVKAVQNFVAAEFGGDVQVQVVNDEKCLKSKRELTDTSFITFSDTNARDKALKTLEAKYQKAQGFGITV